MTPRLSRGADRSEQPLFFATFSDVARTPVGISFKRLAQASGFALIDRLLVVGVLSAPALAGLIASGAWDVTLIRPDQPYPRPGQADVVWLLDVRDAAVISPRLKVLVRRLAPGARLVIELSSPAAILQAESLAALLRIFGLHTVRVELLRPGVALVRACAPVERRQAA